jgi:WD repeat-containing protein 24
MACMSIWLSDLSRSEGGCATPGCSHDCGPGPRRELNRQMLMAETKRRDSASRSAGVGVVKHDTWTKGESKAVQKVRGMLGAAGVAAATGGGGAGAGQGGGQASGAVSPKKVRLVTPVEQSRRKGAAARAGTAPE